MSFSIEDRDLPTKNASSVRVRGISAELAVGEPLSGQVAFSVVGPPQQAGYGISQCVISRVPSAEHSYSREVFGQRAWWNAKPIGTWKLQIVGFPPPTSKPKPPQEIYFDIHVSALQ